MRNWAFLFVLLLGSAVSAYAVDSNNNGNLTDDEFPVDPGTFVGNPDGREIVQFPTSADTWNLVYYPYWWHVGDTVYGTHTVSLSTVNHADLTVYLSYSSLSPGCGFVNIDFRIAGTTVGSFQILPEDGLGPIYASFDFADQTPPFELRYYETNQVVGGCGSISFDESGMNTIDFSGGPSPTIDTTWGSIKALFE
jgi:hypothetical protein